MFVVMCVLNNTYLVGRSYRGFHQKEHSSFHETGYTTKFGTDVKRFRRHLEMRTNEGKQYYTALLRKSDAELRDKLNIKPKQFESEEAALAFLEEYPPRFFPKEFCVVIEV